MKSLKILGWEPPVINYYLGDISPVGKISKKFRRFDVIILYFTAPKVIGVSELPNLQRNIFYNAVKFYFWASLLICTAQKTRRTWSKTMFDSSSILFNDYTNITKKKKKIKKYIRIT